MSNHRRTFHYLEKSVHDKQQTNDLQHVSGLRHSQRSLRHPSKYRAGAPQNEGIPLETFSAQVQVDNYQENNNNVERTSFIKQDPEVSPTQSTSFVEFGIDRGPRFSYTHSEQVPEAEVELQQGFVQNGSVASFGGNCEQLAYSSEMPCLKLSRVRPASSVQQQPPRPAPLQRSREFLPGDTSGRNDTRTMRQSRVDGNVTSGMKRMSLQNPVRHSMAGESQRPYELYFMDYQMASTSNRKASQMKNPRQGSIASAYQRQNLEQEHADLGQACTESGQERKDLGQDSEPILVNYTRKASVDEESQGKSFQGGQDIVKQLKSLYAPGIPLPDYGENIEGNQRRSDMQASDIAVPSVGPQIFQRLSVMGKQRYVKLICDIGNITIIRCITTYEAFRVLVISLADIE